MAARWPASSGTFFGTDPPFDPLNRKLEYGASDLDQRQRFIGSAVYAPPLGNIQNRPLRLIVNGFSFSTIVTAATGQPLTESLSSYPSGGLDGGLTGGLVNNGGSPTGGRVPFLPRNNFYLPNLYNVDIRIAREFHILEAPALGVSWRSVQSVQSSASSPMPDQARRRTPSTTPLPARGSVRGTPTLASRRIRRSQPRPRLHRRFTVRASCRFPDALRSSSRRRFTRRP